MTPYKFVEDDPVAVSLAENWVNGNRELVREKLKGNPSLTATVALVLMTNYPESGNAVKFLRHLASNPEWWNE